LLATGCVESPALVGLLRPRLLLPRTALPAFSAEDWEHVFLHELAHFRRRDHWTQALQLVALCAHWFNPLVWLGFRCLRTDRELAADEWALRHLRGERATAYGDTLLKVLTAQSRGGFAPGLVGIMEDGTQMKQRLRHIAAFVPRRLAGSIAGIVLVLILAAVVLGRSAGEREVDYTGLAPIEIMVTAARAGDRPMLEKQLAAGVDINGIANLKGERTALAAAAAANQLEILRLLLARGANVQLQAEKADTAVVVALKKGWPECADFLLGQGAVCPPGMAAAAKGDARALEQFLAEKPDLEVLKPLCEVAIANGQARAFETLHAAIRDLPPPPNWQLGSAGVVAAVTHGHREVIEAALKHNGNLKNGVIRLSAAATQAPGMLEWLRTKGFKVPDYTDGERLIDATEREDLAEMRRLLDAGTDVNYRGESQWTPLTKAAAWGCPQALRLLLEHFADPNLRKASGNYTPLSLAKTPEIADALVKAGAKVLPEDIDYPVLHGSVEVVQWFMDHGVEAGKTTKQGRTLLFSVRKPETAELLIARGVDINAKDKDGQTALNALLTLNDDPASVVAVFLKHGADPNARVHDITPLMLAPDGATVDLLVAAGADLQARDQRGHNAMATDWFSSDPSRQQALLRHGLQIDAATGTAQLMNAVSLRGDLPAVKALLAMGIDPNVGEPWDGQPGATPLAVALYDGKFSIADALRAGGANNVGLLSEAAARGDLPRMKALLDAGADANERTADGTTPLHFAVRQIQAGAVRLLIERGAEINRFDHFGFTTLALAQIDLRQLEQRHYTFVDRLDPPEAKKALDEIIAALQARKPDANFRNEAGETAAMQAARAGNLLFYVMADEKIALDAQRPDGMTALMLAIVSQPKDARLEGYTQDTKGKVLERYSSRGRIVKVLLEKGADRTLRNAAGKTALDLAQENGNPEILEMMEKAAEKRQ
jgi:ankyrin repeat protein